MSSIAHKIETKDLKVAVIGLGYVGLPLAVAFGKFGFTVTGIDVDLKKVAALNAGRSHVLDVPSESVLALIRRKKFRATADYKALAGVDAAIICVPTPLSKTKTPDMSFIVHATEKIATYLKKGQLIVLESTTYPGTTDEVMKPILEKSGMKVEKDFFLAFSPERVDPGNKTYTTVSIPKVVGGVGPKSAKAASLLYGSVIRTIVEVSSARTAEMVKLLENTFRSVNIGLINEVAMMSNRLGIDIWEVIEAAKTKPFGFMPFYPGPGIGGHCLPIDPLYLSWKSRVHGYEAKMIELASSINESMPHYVVDRLSFLLNDRQVALKQAKVLILGVSYKKNIDDTRESPAIDVIEGLIEKGADISYTDPYVSSFHLNGKTLKSKPLTSALLKKQNCVLILTDHSTFDYASVVCHSRLVLDTRNTLRRHKASKNVYFL